ncbi:hypothetical protein RB4648 [Rhodopirellula baltica SH 1]|uniref:Uncharacterized protein n=1 Tax=Rhodopirellula baltica (strain DSM 10527 / NCIMB 13988 / SH1) TaxID=243090 RepID=Q7US87_RHOBA|nr:hypothetical protein RB4648 [Rhodopirellula baltica SH 1]
MIGRLDAARFRQPVAAPNRPAMRRWPHRVIPTKRPIAESHEQILDVGRIPCLPTIPGPPRPPSAESILRRSVRWRVDAGLNRMTCVAAKSDGRKRDTVISAIGNRNSPPEPKTLPNRNKLPQRRFNASFGELNSAAAFRLPIRHPVR